MIILFDFQSNIKHVLHAIIKKHFIFINFVKQDHSLNFKEL